MEYIDILALLKAFKGSLKNVEVYGRISARLNRPSNLLDSCSTSPNGFFVKMELFAINLSYYSQYLKNYGYSAPNNIYMINGSMCTFVESTGHHYPDFYSIRGTLRFGSRTSTDYVTIFDFKKNGNNWNIEPSIISNIVIDNWDTNSLCYKWISRCYETGLLEQPVEVSGLRKCLCVEQKIVVNESNKSLSDTLKSNLNNVEVIKTTYNTGVKFKKENREKIKEYSDIAKNLQSILENSMLSRQNFRNSLKSDYELEDEVNDYIKFTVKSLRDNLKHKPTNSACTGRMLLSNYMKRFKGANENYLGKKAYEFLIDNFDEVSEFILSHDRVTCDGVAWSLCKTAFANPEVFYAGIISEITGVSFDDLLNCVDICTKNDICFSKLINENPYALQMIYGFDFNTIEYLALCMNKHNDSSLSKMKNIAILNAFINNKNNGSTLFTRNQLLNEKLGLTLTEAKFKSCCAKGTYLTDTTLDNIKYYLHDYSDKLGYDVKGFNRFGYSYIKPLSSSEIQRIISDYCEVGLGIVYENYVTSAKYLEKELFVYNKLYNLGCTSSEYRSEDIEKYICEYESIIGFKLEPEQRAGVYLLLFNAGAVAGSAGSGKTTTSNCFVYVLERLEPGIKFKFATPTGKAAKRMQEVVKRPVKTMASMFHAGESDNTIFEKEEHIGVESNIAYFFDEVAMVTIDLMYSILSGIDESSKAYFFGDFHQLPPIGKGLPFKNLLRFLPCVFLTVSKRAAEGSQITDNSNRINEFSEPNNWKELESGKDFFLCPCNEDTMYILTLAICKKYLGKACTVDEESAFSKYVGTLPVVDNLSKDDIQVVTPLQKATYKWGSTQLNKVLQPIFNTNTGYSKTFVYQRDSNEPYYQKFIIGDRVIHTEKNMYSMQWYSTYKDGQFQKIYGCGICNGEVGKIVAFYPANSCEFYDEIEEKPKDFEYKDSLRIDSAYNDDNTWFVVVEYYDYMSDRNFYILYRCKENINSDVKIGKSFSGEDLSKLNLFYAGTTHKLQGSQAKVIISLLGVVNYKGFITRNMMYTVYTRGECVVFALGSVGNERNSMLSIARTDIAEEGILTVGEIL